MYGAAKRTTQSTTMERHESNAYRRHALAGHTSNVCALGQIIADPRHRRPILVEFGGVAPGSTDLVQIAGQEQSGASLRGYFRRRLASPPAVDRIRGGRRGPDRVAETGPVGGGRRQLCNRPERLHRPPAGGGPRPAPERLINAAIRTC